MHFDLYTGGGTDRVGWRLLGANNRQLARGLLSYPDADSCRADLVRLLTWVSGLDRRYVRAADRAWVWRLRREGIDVVVSGHAFDRRGRCEESCERFVTVAPFTPVRELVTALPAPGTRGMRPSVLRAGTFRTPRRRGA